MGNLHEAEKRELVSSPLSSVSITGIHVDTKNCWLVPHLMDNFLQMQVILEIKCPFSACHTNVLDLTATKNEYHRAKVSHHIMVYFH